MAEEITSTTYYIPRKTKIKTEFVRGITGGDLFWLGGWGMLTFALAASGAGALGWVLAVVCVLVGGIGVIRDKEKIRVYTKMWLWFKYLAHPKKFGKLQKRGVRDIATIIPYEKIVEEKYIFHGLYYSAVVEIEPIEFGLLDTIRQELVINMIANCFRRLTEKQSAALMNMERAMVLDRYIDYEVEKYTTVANNIETGMMTEEELEPREIIFAERGLLLEYMNEEMKVYKNSYYIVVYDSDKATLDTTIDGICSTLSTGGLQLGNHRLTDRELAVFLKNCYDKEFDERDVRGITDERMLGWITPNKINFTSQKVMVDEQNYQCMTLKDYPLHVSNAWGYGLFNMEGCRTVLNFHQVPKEMAEKQIDKAIVEMRSQIGNSKKSSAIMDSETQLETVNDLLAQIKRGNEMMYDCNIHLVVQQAAAKEVKARLKEDGFVYSEMYGRQTEVFKSANISRHESIDDHIRGIPTTTLAATFPFISDKLQDDRGICIGYNSYPVFVDFFKRDNIRVNSNMIIIGKSGSGKSFATKSILCHFAADNTKIFILDPEREYTKLSHELHGNFIDVGNAGKGRFNPFHIYPAMVDEDENGQEFDDTFESHLRFLESFFRVVMEGIRADALESLNGLVAKLYQLKGIDKFTDFIALKPEDFPIFQDLYELAKRYLAVAPDEFSKINYRILVTYLEKFAEGGRFSGLWNGPATIRTNENFVTFNFMTLLANKNNIVADAQMLLVFKYLDGEIIKNRDYNTKYNTNRKIIIVVDEAHVFINEQRPIALDFMFNMAKRIRKYSGMQIIITQNIKDFVGSPAIAKKSAAIINASQYSMIFALAPNDMTDLVTLYKNSGEINKTEQQQITNNARGECFFISGPMNRTLISIDTSEEMRKIFE